MNGRETVSKLGGSSLTQAHIFGLPLTTDILIEVICNGSTNTDKNVSSCAQHTISLIKNIRNYFSKKLFNLNSLITRL